LRSFVGRRYGRFGDEFIDEVAILTHERAFARLNEYQTDKGASFQTWMNWQSRAAAKQVMRERYGSRFVQYAEVRHEPWVETVPGPADIYEESRRSRVLRQELLALSEDGRLSVTLHDKDGLTFAETAQAAGTTVKRVRLTREQALAVLERRLQERGVSPAEVDSTPVPAWHGWDVTDRDDEWTASVTAVLPDGPSSLVGAAAREEDESG
jgi:RNA polymerase sigma factor (sigma-70 family)